jgi:hypothetical protein
MEISVGKGKIPWSSYGSGAKNGGRFPNSLLGIDIFLLTMILSFLLLH